MAEKIKTPLNPGGVAVTEGGLVGVRGLGAGGLRGGHPGLFGLHRRRRRPDPREDRSGDRFYVADTRGDALLAYRARPELERIARVGIPGGSPYGIALDPERDHLWVTLTAENRVVQYALDRDTPREIASYPTVRQPNSVAVNPANGRVFVTGSADGELQILDP